MVNVKRETDSCILCTKENCGVCSLNPDLEFGFVPNQQTVRMMRDKLVTEEAVSAIHMATMEDRCRAGLGKG